MGVSLSILHKHLTTPGGTLKEEDFRSMLIEILDSLHGITSSFPDLEFTKPLQWASPLHDKVFTIAQMHSSALGLSVTDMIVQTAPTAVGVTAYSCEKRVGAASKFAFVRVRSMRWCEYANLLMLCVMFDILTSQACMAPQMYGIFG
jgi:hypothetical protein